MAPKSKISKEEHFHLANVIESEGFGYYMLHYGPDIKTIAKLGFDPKEVTAACKLFSKIEEKAMEGMEYAEELSDT